MVNIVSSNALVSSDNKPLLEPVLAQIYAVIYGVRGNNQ